jgi:OmpA-OmpF porin, OOP family
MNAQQSFGRSLLAILAPLIGAPLTVCAGVTAAAGRAQVAAVPPAQILFADDLAAERVGTFPRRMQFRGGQADVVEMNGRRVLRATTSLTWFEIPLARMLPERFTIELDVQSPPGRDGIVITTSKTGAHPGAYYRHPYLLLGHRSGTGVKSAKPDYGPTQLSKEVRLDKRLTPVRVTADGTHVQMFVGGRMMVDVPSVTLPRSDRLWLVVPRAEPGKPAYIGNIRVAEGIVDFPDTVANVKGEEGAVVAGGDAGSEPGGTIWDNYDFVPGDRVLFADDFSDDRIGAFPKRLEYLGGKADVVEIRGRRMLRATDTLTWFRIPLPEKLPERFTIELDLLAPSSLDGLAITTAKTTVHPGAYYRGSFLQLGHRAGTGVKTPRPADGPTSVSSDRRVHEKITPVRIMADGDYVQVYVAEHRVANVPNANLARSDSLWVVVPRATEKNPVYLGNVRVAAGGTRLYDALVAEGHVAARGILFDTNEAVIRPESTKVIAEIAAMLHDHPDLSLRIEGHTDDVGDDASNQALSERRANAVRDRLTRRFGVDGVRLEAVGFGETKPVATNDTPEGRQMNRRVELVRK